MLLVDASGYTETRFKNIDDAFGDMIHGTNKNIVINRNIASGVSTYVESRLETLLGHGNVRRIWMGTLMPDVQKTMEYLAGVNTVIVDEAELLDSKPDVAAALRTLESGGTRLVYIMLVPTEVGIANVMQQLEALPNV